MKKSLLALFLVCMLVLTACGSNNGKKEAVNGGTTGTTNADALKVVLLIPGTLGDKSFFDAANRGLELVRDELGAQVKVIEMGTDSTKWEPTYTDIVNEDFDIIISGGSEITEMFNAVAENNPDKKFINYDTDIEDVPANVYAMSYATNELSYVAGAAAALISTSDLPQANAEKVIGFLGGMDIPGINAFLIGYIEGAQAAVPEIKVLTSYAGDFTDPAKGKELSLIQYNSGVDIIFNVAGGTGLGIFDAAVEKNQYAIGVDSDQAMLLNDTDQAKANLILTSAIKNIDKAILGAVTASQDNTLEYGTRKVLGIADGGVGIAENEIFTSNVNEEIRTKIKEIEQKIVNKEVTVSNAMGMETAEIKAIRDAVNP